MVISPTARLAVVIQLREALAGLMEIDTYAWDDRGALTLRGDLQGPSQVLYRSIRTRLEPLGFTPLLQRHGAQDVLVAVPGVTVREPTRVGLPLLLFLATVLTVLIVGALYEGIDLSHNPAGLLAGAPFAGTILSILVTHEMGHYVVGRLRHAPVSLPYFIPLPPPISFIGTMGAVIVQREPMEDRRTLLEIGIAGPLAGLVVAVPLLLYGLAHSRIGPAAPPGGLQEGNSLLYAGLKWLVFGRMLPGGGQDVQLNSVAWGAWIGLLVTMLNLIPVGQLDGGHVAYALLGRRADYLAYGMIAVCLVIGIMVRENYTWLVWAALTLLLGARHPEPLNDIPRLGWWHTALAVCGLLCFVVLFMPQPLRIIGG